MHTYALHKPTNKCPAITQRSWGLKRLYVYNNIIYIYIYTHVCTHTHCTNPRINALQSHRDPRGWSDCNSISILYVCMYVCVYIYIPKHYTNPRIHVLYSHRGSRGRSDSKSVSIYTPPNRSMTSRRTMSEISAGDVCVHLYVYVCTCYICT